MYNIQQHDHFVKGKKISLVKRLQKEENINGKRIAIAQAS